MSGKGAEEGGEDDLGAGQQRLQRQVGRAVHGDPGGEEAQDGHGPGV